MLLVITVASFLMQQSLISITDIKRIEDSHQYSTTFKKAFENESLPLFYASVSPSNFPDTLYKIKNPLTRNRLKALLRRGGDWKLIEKLNQTEYQLFQQSDATGFNNVLLNTTDPTVLNQLIKNIPDSLSKSVIWANWMNEWDAVQLNLKPARLVIPRIHWFGSQNAFHLWFSKVLRFEFGNSSVDNQPVKDKVKEALSWTLSVNLFALMLIYFFSIILGEYIFRSKRNIDGWLMFFYTLPRFFLGMILIILFSSNTVHPFLHIFPTPGFIDSMPGVSWVTRWITYGKYLILPLICMVLPGLAYVVSLYRTRLQEESKKPYAFMSWVRGESASTLLSHHLRKNALLPLIALLGSELPVLISGSVAIEVLFNIPGMGRLMMQSILLQDWNTVFAILLLTALITIVGRLISDLMTQMLDQRIK